MRCIDLNCDMGESFGAWSMGNDAEMIELVTSANVACGFHAGDPLVIHRTIALAKERGVAVGAHPSFLDLWGFGRRKMLDETPETIERMLVYQIGAVQAVARGLGHPLRHVKTHGSLGNLAAVSFDHAMAVARALQTVDPELIFIVLPHTETERAGERLGLRLAREIYADRSYDDTGNLTPRSEPGAVIEDGEVAVERTMRMLAEGAIVSATGKRIPVRIDSVGLHGDSPHAVALARRLRAALEDAGIPVRPLAQVLS